MKLTLTITASANALAKILSALSEDEGHGGITTAQYIQTDVRAGGADQHSVIAPVTLETVSPSPVMPEVVAIAPTIPGEPEFDSSGLAYDERIHSAKKGTTKDGKWRRKRDIADDYYNAVEAELRARYGAQVTPEVAAPVQAIAVTNHVPPMPENPMGNDTMPQFINAVNMVPVDTAAAVVQNSIQPIAPVAVPQPIAPVAVPQPIAPVAVPQPIAPVAVPQPIAPAQQEPVTFHTIMQTVGNGMAAGTLTPDYLVQLTGEINQQLGLSMQSFTDMADKQNAVDYCWAAFARDGKI